MHTQRLYVWAALLLALVLTITACVHRATPTVTTAEQRIAQSNAAIAAANRSLTESVIASQRSGLLSVGQASEVLAWAGRVATANKGIAQILAGADPWPVRALKIRDLAAQLAPPAWIDRYASNAQMQAIVTSAQLIISLVKLIAQETAASASGPPPGTPVLGAASVGAILLLILQLLDLLVKVAPSAVATTEKIRALFASDPVTADGLAAINAGAIADTEATEAMIVAWRKEQGLG